MIRRAHLALTAVVLASPAFAQSVDMMAHDAGPSVFRNIRTELDYSGGNGGLVTWDVDGWIGGDAERIWVRSEGEVEDGRAGSAEAQLYYGWNIDPFWDVLAGMRQDFEPGATTYLAASLVGLAKYDFETEASLFLSDRGDLSARLSQSFDVALTQRLIAEPHAELNLSAQDVPERQIGAGFSELELGLQLRYEFTRKFAPYVDLVWQRKLGETATLARAAGDDPEQTTIRFGLRVWF